MNAETAVFRFLDLPRELRDLIYEQTISYRSIQTAILAVNKAALSSASTPPSEFHRLKSLRRTPPLLLTNRQIHHEALATLQRQELLLTTPLTGADIFFGWGGPTGTGISLADLLPNQQLARISSLRFCFQVWEASYIQWLHEHDAEYKAYAWCFPDGQEPEHAPQASLKDDKGESVMVYGKAWGKMWLHVIDVVTSAEETVPRRRLCFEMDRQSAAREMNAAGEEILRTTSEVVRYDVSMEVDEVCSSRAGALLKCAELSCWQLVKLKTAIWTSWQRGQYDPLVRLLDQYRASTRRQPTCT